MGNKAVFVDFCYGTNYNNSKDYSLEAEAAERIKRFSEADNQADVKCFSGF